MRAITNSRRDSHAAVTAANYPSPIAHAGALVLANLMYQTQSGCAKSFKRMYQLTSPKLMGVICRINRDRREAEEVLQEVFVRAWTYRADFDGERGNVMSWLASIAHNEAVNSLRHRNCRPIASTNLTHDEDGEAYDSIPCGSPSPPELAAQSRTVRAVTSCLAALSSEQRLMLMLAFFDGLSHSEIAVHLGKPLGSVKSVIRRALHSMRPALAGHLGAG
jgi:RNA polymerase sigma factor (sigma-70 family)